MEAVSTKHYGYSAKGMHERITELLTTIRKSQEELFFYYDLVRHGKVNFDQTNQDYEVEVLGGEKVISPIDDPDYVVEICTNRDHAELHPTDSPFI